MSCGLDEEWFNKNKLSSAYDLAKVSFNGQNGAIKRSTGERYFDHVKAVSYIGTIEIGDKDPTRAIARLFHDNDEDTRIGSSVLLATFGKDVTDLVNLVTNPPKTWDKEIDAKRKKVAFLAMQEFPQWGMIKVPDRIHNNRTQEIVLIHKGIITPDHFNPNMIDWGKRKSEETRKFIYPIAEKLWWKYFELLDQSQTDFDKAIAELWNWNV
jgi:(p)ppGpp synthase/HD superfamily hydrolase